MDALPSPWGLVGHSLMERDDSKESHFPRRDGQLLVWDLGGEEAWRGGYRRQHSLLAGHCAHHSPADPGQPQPATMPSGLRCPPLMPAWELGGGHGEKLSEPAGSLTCLPSVCVSPSALRTLTKTALNS